MQNGPLSRRPDRRSRTAAVSPIHARRRSQTLLSPFPPWHRPRRWARCAAITPIRTILNWRVCSSIQNFFYPKKKTVARYIPEGFPFLDVKYFGHQTFVAQLLYNRVGQLLVL